MKKIFSRICLGGLILVLTFATAFDKVSATSGETAAVSPVDPGNIVSAYAGFNSAVEETLLTVPADKHFVLTDIIGMASIEIKQGNITKLKVRLGYSPDKNTRYANSISIGTGIVFSPGTKVVVFPYPVGLGMDTSYGYITMSGYYF